MSDETNQTLSEIEVILKDFLAIKAKYTEEFVRASIALNSSLINFAKSLFKDHPNIHSITWKQYKPYYNKGGDAQFSVHEPMFHGSSNSGGENVKWTINSWSLSKKEKYSQYGITDEQALLMYELAKIIHRQEDLMLQIFGDHALITGTETGFSIEEFDHD